MSFPLGADSGSGSASVVTYSALPSTSTAAGRANSANVCGVVDSYGITETLPPKSSVT